MLTDITSDDIEGFYDFLRERGDKNITLKHYADILRPAFKKAYKEKRIHENPYDFVSAVKSKRPVMNFYNKAEIEKFFEAIRGNKFELAFKVAACYGFRRSELLGLRWSAIDFENKTISINHKLLVVGRQVELSDTLKNTTSRRTLPLLPMIEEMLLHKKEEIEDDKNFYGNTYNQKYLEYVFVDETGKILYPNHLTQSFVDLLNKKNLKRIRFHDLRHSCASIMLANGVQMKQIQEWLGHASFSTTADIYSHLDYSSKIQSAEKLSQALGIAAPKQESKNRAEKDFLKNARREMVALGFSTIDEYLNYIDQKEDSEEEDYPKPKHDYSM